MKFLDKILDLSIQYENLKSESLSLRIGYFMVRYFFKIPIISSLGLVNNQLFQKVGVSKYLADTVGQTQNQMQMIYLFVLVAYTISILSVVFLGYKQKNKHQIKLLFLIIMFFQVFNGLGCYFLISIITGSQLLVAYRVMSVLLFILIQFSLIIIDKVLISFEGHKSNKFSHNNNNKIFISHILEIFVYCFTIFTIKMGKGGHQSEQIFFILILIIYAFRIYIYLGQKYYIDDLTHLIQIIGTVTCLSILTVTLMYETTLSTLLYKNLPYVTLTINIFTIIAIHRYLSFTQHELMFLNIQQIVEREQFDPYLEALFRLWVEQKSQYNSKIIRSFRKSHKASCSDLKCRCRQSGKGKREPGRSLTTSQYNKLIEMQDTNRQFLQTYMKSIFQQLVKHTKRPKTILQILFLRLQLFDELVFVNHQLKQLSKTYENNFQFKVGSRILNSKINQIIQKQMNDGSKLNAMAVIGLEEKLHEMHKLILNEIRIKAKKWRNLCLSSIRNSDIQQYIIQEIANIIQFENIYTANIHHYKKSSSFNYLSLFYFSQITFLRQKVQQIELNLRQYKKNQKPYFITHEKELQKNVFNENCCMIEFNFAVRNGFGKVSLQQEVNLQVVNCCRAATNIFKYPKIKMIGQNVHKLFPSFLRDDVDKFLCKLFQFKDDILMVDTYYFIDKYKHVFQALVSIKILCKEDTISCVFFILEKQTQKVILMNSQGLIQNVGKLYYQHFSPQYQKVPFYSLIYSQKQIQKLKFCQSQRKQKCIMFDANQLREGWSEYLHKVSNYIQDSDLKTMLKLNSSQSCQINKRTINKQFHKFLNGQKRRLMDAFSNGTIIQYKDMNLTKPSLPLLTVIISYKKSLMNEQSFYVVKLENILKKICPQNRDTCMGNIFNNMVMHQQSVVMMMDEENKERQSPRKNSSKTTNQCQTWVFTGPKEQKSQFILGFKANYMQNQGSEVQSIQYDKVEKKKMQNFILETDSTQSSLETDDLVHFNGNFVKICFNLFKNSDQINDKRLKFYTFNSILVSLVLLALLCGSYTILQLNFHEVKDIFQADGAVSDVMQLTLFMYNRGINFKLFRDNVTQLQVIRQSAIYQRQYIHELISQQQKNFLTQVTSFTNSKIYQYLRDPVLWITPQNHKDPARIQTKQMLSFFHKITCQVQDESMKLISQQAQKNIDLDLQIMRMNIPELKRINHGTLTKYKQLTDQTMGLTNTLIVIFVIGHVMLSVINFLTLRRQKLFRRVQQIQGYSIYKVIPRRAIESLTNYFSSYWQLHKQPKDLLKYQTYYEPYALDVSYLEKQNLRHTTSKFISNNIKSRFQIWKMLLTLIFLNILFGIFMIKVYQIVSPIKQMMRNVNQLMDSQNYLLEAYFDLKSKIIIQDASNLDEQFFNQLLQSQNSADVKFNQISLKSLDLLKNYDQHFKKDFIYLLINDVCEIAKRELSLRQYEKCRGFFRINFLENGVALGMNFFTRKVKQTIYGFRQKVRQLQMVNATQQSRQQTRAYFKQQLRGLDFRELDQSIFFMFKLFQLTQARIFSSLQTTIQQTMHISFILVILQIFIISIIYPLILAKNYHQQKIELSKLYLSFLLVPAPVSKSNKAFANKVEQVLELQC